MIADFEKRRALAAYLDHGAIILDDFVVEGVSHFNDDHKIHVRLSDDDLALLKREFDQKYFDMSDDEFWGMIYEEYL